MASDIEKQNVCMVNMKAERGTALVHVSFLVTCSTMPCSIWVVAILDWHHGRYSLKPWSSSRNDEIYASQEVVEAMFDYCKTDGIVQK